MNRVVSCVVSAFLITASAIAADSPAKAAFERLKKLAGNWEGVSQGQTFKVVYKVTGAGSALIETQFPDTAHEMVSVYHMNGDKLMLTHYCAAQNQPTMKLLPGKNPKVLRFDFVSGSNMKPSDVHIHNVKYQFLAEDHIISEWGMHINGKPGATEKFDLHRVK